MNVLIVAKGLGRYRMESNEGFITTFLNPQSLGYHLSKVMRLSKDQQAKVWAELNAHGKCKMEMSKAA